MSDVVHHLPIKMVDIDNRGAPVLIQALERLDGEKFVVFSGTALGLYRDSDLIPSDTDIDIVMLASQGIEGRVRDLFSDMPLGLEARQGGHIQQLAYLPNDVILDIHFYYPDGANYVCHHSGGTFRIKREIIDKREFKDTRYGRVPFPHDPEYFFEKKYGPDWKIPQYRKKGRYA